MGHGAVSGGYRGVRRMVGLTGKGCAASPMRTRRPSSSTQSSRSLCSRIVIRVAFEVFLVICCILWGVRRRYLARRQVSGITKVQTVGLSFLLLRAPTLTVHRRICPPPSRLGRKIGMRNGSLHAVPNVSRWHAMITLTRHTYYWEPKDSTVVAKCYKNTVLEMTR